MIHLTFNKTTKKIKSHVNGLFRQKTGPLSIVRPGQIVVIGVLFLSIGVILASTLFGRTANFLRFGGNSLRQEQAINFADAGVDYAVWQLNKTAGAFTGTGSPISFTIGSFIVSIVEKTPPNPQVKTIVSTGYIPDSTNPREKQTIKADVTISSTSVSFRYAVQVGDEGVDLSQSSTINGNVYTNGSITAGNGNQQTISGDAYAVGPIAAPPILVTGTKVTPASPQPLPDMSATIQAAKDAALAGGTTTCSPTCTISNSGNIGPQKYIGNLAITNNAIVTMKGPIWVADDGSTTAGNFSTSQGGTTLKLDNGFGSYNTLLVAQGTINLTQGGNLQPTNANPKGYITLVSESNSSQAIQISQSGTTAVFSAPNGTAILSQTANVSSLVSKKLVMQNSATLNYDTGLVSAQFTSGPGGSWQIKRGTYLFK